MELKSLGRLQISDQEKKSLEFARLLESKVVGIEAEDVPLRAEEEAAGGGETNEETEDEFGSKSINTANESSIISSRKREAMRNIVTSQDILEQAFSAQRELALRLDQDINLTEQKMDVSKFGLLEVDMKIRELSGYEAPRPWTNKHIYSA